MFKCLAMKITRFLFGRRNLIHNTWHIRLSSHTLWTYRIFLSITVVFYTLTDDVLNLLWMVLWIYILADIVLIYLFSPIFWWFCSFFIKAFKKLFMIKIIFSTFYIGIFFFDHFIILHYYPIILFLLLI